MIKIPYARKVSLFTILATMQAGCASGPSATAICDATQALRDAHTEALLDDGGDRSAVTGAALIGALDAGCGD